MASTEEIIDYIKSGKTEKSYEVTDDKGNFITLLRESQNKDWSEAAKTGKAPIYKNEGGWSSAPEVSIKLDEKTGDITVKAPQSYLDSPALKNTYLNSTALKTLSQSYKQNKDATFPDPDDESKTITVKELVEKYNEGLQAFNTAKQSQEALRYDIFKTTKNEKLANALTETDFIYMSSTGTGENDTDNTLISIPTTIKTNIFERIQKLPGYNRDFSQLSRGQFRDEIYNVSKSSREDIVDLVTSLATRAAEITAKDNITAADATEYARIQALLTYINKNEPEQGFWEEAGLFAEAGGKGALSGFATVGGNLLIAAEGAGNILNYILTPWKWGSDIKDVPGYSTMLREDITAQRETEQQELAQIAYINKNATAIAMLAKVGAEIAGTYIVGKFAGEVTEYAVGSLTNKAVLSNLTKSVEGIANIGEILTAEEATMQATGVVEGAKAILEVAKTNPSALLAGTNLLLNVMKQAGQTGKVVEVLNNAVKAANTVGRISPYLNLTTQLVVDVATHDATIFRDIIENGDTKQVGELLWTVAGDAGLFAVAMGFNALVNYFPKTATASKMNTRISKLLIGAEAGVENAKEGIKEIVLRDSDYISKIKNVSKRQVGEANSLIRAAKLAVWKAQGVEATEKSLDDLVALQNVVNEGKSNLAAIQAQMINPDTSPVFAPAYFEAVDSIKKITTAVDEAGMPIPKISKDITGYSIYNQIIPKSVDNYMGWYYRGRQIEGFYAKNGFYEPGMEKDLVKSKQVVEEFEKNWSQVAQVAKDQIPVFVKAYSSLGAYEDAFDLRDKAKAAQEAKSPLYAKDGYMRVQRIKERQNYLSGQVELIVNATTRPTTISEQGYIWGDVEDDFANPMQVLEDRMKEVAQVQHTRTMITHMPQNIAPRKVTVPGNDYKRAETVKALKGKFKNNVKENFKGLVEGVSNKGLVNDAVSNTLQHSEYLKFKEQTQAQGAKVTRAKTKEYKVTAVDKRAYVDAIPDTELNDLALAQNGITFSNILPEEFDLATHTTADLEFNTAPIRKEISSAISQNALYIGWDKSLYSYEYRPSDLPKIKTSSYKRLTGIKTLKDADPLIKPYLSESGVDLEDGLVWSEYMPQFVGDVEGGAFTGTPDDVVDFYISVINASKTSREMTALTYDNFVAACEFDPDLPNRLDRLALQTNNEYLSSKTTLDEIRSIKRREAIQNAENLWQEDLDKLSAMSALDKAGQHQLVSDLNNLVTEYIYSGVLSSQTSRETLDALVANEPDKDLAKEYIILSELYDYKKELAAELRGQVSGLVRNQIQLYNGSVPKNKQINEETFITTFTDLFEETLFDRRNRAMHALRDAGSDLVDEESIYKETREYMAQISKAKADPNMIQIVNSEGLVEIIEVDPMVADLVKYDPTRTPKTWFQAFMQNKAFELSHRMFRFNTTTLNAGSFANQAFRDSLNSYIATGNFKPMNLLERDVAANFGARIAADYQTLHPTLYAQLQERAKETGTTIEETATRYAMSIGESYAGATTETAATRLDTSRNAWDKTQNLVEKWLEKLEYVAGGFREEYFRKANYAAALQSALSENKSIDTAVEWALRISRDATTDFTRMTYHLQAFTGSIPYLRAAVNGSKSFWRLLSLDPVGVMTRLIGGIVIPVMACTLSVLNDEENKKYYKTLKEYEKENQLIYSVNGQLFQIPIPQEIGAFVSPMRHLVEALNDANEHDYGELLLNDFFNAMPYNMGAFLDIDGNILAEDATLMERIGMEAMSILSTFSPTLVKTAFMLTYGVDPYSGKPINKSYWDFDEDGNRVLMDSTQSEFAQWLGNVTGGAPSVIATAITGIFGNTSLELLDAFTALAQYATSDGQEGSLTTLPEKLLSDVAGKLTVTEYDRTKNQWNQQINHLYDLKESLREGYIDYTQKINSATTQEEREKWTAKREDYISDFYKEIQTMCTNLVEIGGGSIDSYRLAALVNLVNWYDENNTSTSAYARYLTQEEKDANKEAARRTIERLGITATPNQSLLGYTYRDASGEVKVKFYTPLEILNAQSIYYTSVDIYQVELDNILKEAGLTTKTKNDGYYALSTKAEKKQYRKDWNEKVVKAIAPYVEKYGVENIFRNASISEHLDDYFYTDNYYSAKNYLQKVFGD